MQQRVELLGLAMVLGAVTLFSLTLPLSRAAVTHMDPVFLGLGRSVLAGLVAALLLGIKRQKLPARADLKRILLVSGGVVLAYPFFTTKALEQVDASHASVIIGLLPLVTAIAAAFISGERPPVRFWLACLLGSTLVVIFALRRSTGAVHLADLLLLLAVLCSGIGSANGAHVARRLGAWQVMCWALILAQPALIAILALHGAVPLGAPLTAWAAFTYLGLISQLFAFFLFYRGLSQAGIVKASQVQLLQPFLTILASALLLGEAISLTTIFFAAAVSAAVFVARRAHGARAAVPAPAKNAGMPIAAEAESKIQPTPMRG